MHNESYSPTVERYLLTAIVVLILLYFASVVMGLPQTETEVMNLEGEIFDHHLTDAHRDEHSRGPEEFQKSQTPSLWAVAPFGLLLGAIALFPLLRFTQHWWESNLNRFLVAGGCGLLTLVYYAAFHAAPVERHFGGHGIAEPTTGSLSWLLPVTVLQNSVLGEYIPFIVLLFSLYTICGGIRITGDLPAHPATNTALIAIGGLLASFIGTTGAAMVLIRPLLETNSERKHVRHTVIFFIFVVCNCGGCLLPIGDPPLFLGYLEGVDFFWTLTLWKQWAAVNVSLLTIYFLWDWFLAYPHESATDISLDELTIRSFEFRGLWPNIPLLLGIVLAVAILEPSKPVPFTNWHAWLWLREIVQLSLVGLSLILGKQAIRRDNQFNYAAIVEVAALFLGIFICMQPALQILEVRGASLGIDTPAELFWYTGGLSAVLDNAPTYVVFFKTAQALHLEGPSQAGVPIEMLTAISLGAVFMGAMTYIGNGPNFMVKSLAEKAGVKMPSFFGYLAYSLAILLPLQIVMQLLFV